MKKIHIVSGSREDTIRLGTRFAKVLKPGDIICLFGTLGAGKTTLVKGLAKGLRVKPEKVHSPTFILLNIYDGKVPVYHFDLYRIESPDLPGMGYEEFFYGDGVAVIEWSEKLGDFMPKDYWRVELAHGGGDIRKVAISSYGQRYKERFGKLMGLFA